MLGNKYLISYTKESDKVSAGDKHYYWNCTLFTALKSYTQHPSCSSVEGQLHPFVVLCAWVVVYDIYKADFTVYYKDRSTWIQHRPPCWWLTCRPSETDAATRGDPFWRVLSGGFSVSDAAASDQSHLRGRVTARWPWGDPTDLTVGYDLTWAELSTAFTVAWVPAVDTQVPFTSNQCARVMYQTWPDLTSPGLLHPLSSELTSPFRCTEAL